MMEYLQIVLVGSQSSDTNVNAESVSLAAICTVYSSGIDIYSKRDGQSSHQISGQRIYMANS